MNEIERSTSGKNLKIGKTACFVIVLAGLVLLILGNRDKNGISFGPYRLYTVLTGSMSPTFNAGSVIITKKADVGGLKAGDILTYAPFGDGMLVTHRIAEVISDDTGYRYITKGDANNVNDQAPVPHEYVVGRVVFWINGLGNALLFIRTPHGIFTVTVVVLAMLFLLFLFDILMKYTKKGKESNEHEEAIGKEVTR